MWSFPVTVDPAWIDYNNHLNDMAYAQVVGLVNERVLDALDLGEAYRARTGCSCYTVDLHVRYLAEVGASDRLRAEIRLGECGPKKLVLCTTLLRGGDDTDPAVIAAEAVVTYLNVDTVADRTREFDPATRHALGVT